MLPGHALHYYRCVAFDVPTNSILSSTQKIEGEVMDFPSSLPEYVEREHPYQVVT